jgi:cellulose synthase/poly-beta-1,6-N-acetylglucosamine synthase-like glycosyltransferase/peptidoglycan/xylan/chitin deacetylase (PgdA/CDA1 family)/spore germination protein YaaH
VWGLREDYTKHIAAAFRWKWREAAFVREFASYSLVLGNMSQQIFLDPDRKRWKRLRRVLDVAAVLSTLVLVTFFFSVIRRQTLPELLLPAQKRNYKALKENQPPLKAKGARPARRVSKRKPSEIPLNTDEGIRAAFYVDDESSYSSLKQHIHQIDLLFPDWLHVISPDGSLKGATPLYPVHFYDVVDSAGVHGIDPENKVRRVIESTKEDTEVFPMLNDYNSLTGNWGEAVGPLLKDHAATEHLRQQIDAFMAGSPNYRGIALDLEEVPDDAEAGYLAFVAELYSDFQAKNLRLYVNVQVSADDDEVRALGKTTDGIILMNYDEHQTDSPPGPIASQDWFEGNLRRVLKLVPKEKILCAMGNYGYDWTEQLPEPGAAKGGKAKKPAEPKIVDTRDLTVQEAWQEAADSEADVHLEGDELNAHFAYDDEDSHQRHQVWFLDGVTALNEMRAARQMGLRTFALWRLGEEDPTLWSVWDHPSAKDAQNGLKVVPPGQDVNSEGEGDILRVTERPASGVRTISMDSENFTITDERMPVYPRSYTIQYSGYHPAKLALTFDDGPDPKWTPKVLDILKREKVKGTFFVIGQQAEDNVGLLQRYVREGHEIGNHTFTHPDISEISPRQLELELNLTERFFASTLGLQPLYFRPPYSIDQEPDTNDQAAPVDLVEQMGYIIIGDKIDTDDWNEHPRKSPQEITDNVLAQLAAMKERPWFRGSIILMHDGGGDRSATVAALPLLIETLRAKGYEIVPVSELMGKTTAEVMPPISPKMRWQARVDSIAFLAYGIFVKFGVFVFFFGDVLMSGRLIVIGLLALIDRLRTRKLPEGRFEPPVAVLVPGYNEEKVIVRTVRSVLKSDYPNMRVIVIDDGSKDRTFEVAREAFAAEIADGRVTVLTKANGGKAEALNFGIEHLDEDFYVGIDADTVIAPDAVSKLVRHFADPEIGAVAGNAKVGNRVNLWTRWQALEYITSQNFERRALDLFGVVTVVPGAIGAWRTEGVRRAGGYPVNTVAEDADLTMNLLEQGYRVIYEDRSLAFTEAPVDMRGLMKQRFRWSFGTLQAIFKHRGAFTRNRAMGFFALPNILVFQLLLPLVSPLIDLFFVAGVVHYCVDRYFHPAAASAANFQKLLVYFLAFLVIDFLTSSLAFALEPRHQANKGDGWLLFHIWLQRFAYRQVFSIVIFKTIKRAIDGRPFSWDKLDRTAKMSAATERITAGS